MKAGIIRFMTISLSLAAFVFLSISPGSAQSSSGSANAGSGCCGGSGSGTGSSGAAANSGGGASSSASSGDMIPIGAPYHSAGCSNVRGSNGAYDPNAPNAQHLTSDGVNIASYMCLSGAFACPTTTMSTPAQVAAGCGN